MIQAKKLRTNNNMKTLQQAEEIKGGKLTAQEKIIYDLFKDDDRYEFYFDGHNLAARLKDEPV